MVEVASLECCFFIPLKRDAHLSDGEWHTNECWSWLDNELFELYGGRTIAPGHYQGFYRDPDTLAQVNDESRRYIVAVPPSEIGSLRSLLAVACVVFQQKCIYLSVAGRVEFIRRADEY